MENLLRILEGVVGCDGFPEDLGVCVHVRACMVNNSYIRIYTKTYLNKGGVMRKSYQETKLHETLSYPTYTSCVELFESGQYLP